MKKVIWVGSSRRDIRAMPQDVRDALGFGLYHAELEITHPSMKTLKGFGGAGVQEIRADDSSGTYRAVFTVQFSGYLYVLHAFQKKSKAGIKTSQQDMVLIRSRLAWAAQDFKRRMANAQK